MRLSRDIARTAALATCSGVEEIQAGALGTFLSLHFSIMELANSVVT